ncbi:DUF2939 domain-containing protein [Candidatus Accumulibacter phosphatis]|uniref:DUF2939 domain-containing protein n=1 Tax=Candidatus Accumulibacter phosphatis TaxID=327160 RepID=UPI0014861782|nr:DUF2939 domain-containing protein [Candidatus Accumulibacter phosphatis]
MKKTIGITGFLLVSMIGYVAAGPFLTLHAIRSDLVDQDSDALAEHIDFPVLRRNLKEQINTQMMGKTEILKDHPLNILAMGVATQMADRFVDLLVTPDHLVQIIEGKKRLQNAPVSQEERIARKQKLFKNARTTYDSFSRFSVWIPNDQGEDIRLVFARSGLSWKLVNLIAPLDSLKM